MTSKARQLAQSASAPEGRKNILTNGAMQVAQRSTSATNVSTAGYHACDRWDLTVGGRDEAVFTLSQNTSSIVDGFSNSFKLQTTTAESAIASTEYFIVRQIIEAQDLQHLAYATSSAKTTTLSFYVKSSIAATFAVYVYKPDSTARIIGGTYTINSADTWEYKTITFAGDTDSSATINDDNGRGFHISFVLAVGSAYTPTDNTSWADYSTGNLAFGHTGNAVVTTTNATWEITGVQMEVGTVATEFEHRSVTEELALCYRYFYKNTSNTAAFQYRGDFRLIQEKYLSEMRANPTVTVSEVGGAGTFTASSFASAQKISQFTAASYTSTTTHYVSAYTADAEL